MIPLAQPGRLIKSSETVWPRSPDPRQRPIKGRAIMRTFVLATGVALLAAGTGVASAADKPLLGVVSITATEANNARYIKGAEKAAGERGWEVSVIDAQGSADQANAGIQNYVQRG